MKYIQLPYILILCIILFFGWQIIFPLTKIPKSYIDYIVVDAPIQEHEAIPIIRNINRKNSNIKNFLCQSMTIKIDGRRVRLSGELAFVKDKKFRMYIRSFAGLEADLGSNDNYFWFWIKRMQDSALYYADYKDINKTRLKTPFHPLWVMESLGFGVLPTKDIEIQKHAGFWKIIEIRKNISGIPVKKITLIDPEKEVIVGHYLYENNKLIASSEIRKYKLYNDIYVPEEMLVNWIEESKSMLWIFNNPVVNKSNIDSYFWEMPNITPKINMGI